VIGREPREIWQDSLEDGRRRLGRSAKVLAATGLLGGFHVAFGLVALVVTTGALATLMPIYPAHVLGSLTFGIGFVFLTVGRSELFTENFLIPVAAVLSGHSTKRSVLRLWVITFMLNLAGIAIIVLLASVSGVLKPESLTAAGDLATTLAERGVAAAFVAGVLAGTVITVFTWLAEVAEVLFGIAAGTTSADWTDLARNTAVAVAGNVAGGVLLVAFVRSIQAGAE